MQTLFYPDWHELELRQIDHPLPVSGELVVAVHACGICGSELETFAAANPRRTPPLVMGHEFCGVISESTDPSFKTGTRVVCNAVVSCGSCSSCSAGRENLCPDRQVFGMHRPGAFAEFVTVPSSAVFEWPDTVLAEAACLAEPLGNGVHVAARLAMFDPQSALVIGAGSIGLMCLQAIRVQYDIPVAVSDIDDRRLEIAAQLGASLTINPSNTPTADAVRTFSRGPGVDVVVDAVGSQRTKADSIAACRPGGGIVWIGLTTDSIELDSYPITLEEKSILGSYGATRHDMERAIDLMHRGLVDVSSWPAVYALTDGIDAFRKQLDPSRRDIKAILTN